MTEDGKPETIWDVCELTCEAIETRPQNYCQEHWRLDVDGQVIDGKEACGTAYCRAGWMVQLASEGRINDMIPDRINDTIPDRARRMLERAGVDRNDIEDLFAGSAIWYEYGRSGLPVSQPPEPGTEAYVKAGVAGMRRFMEKYEQQLKATNQHGRG